MENEKKRDVKKQNMIITLVMWVLLACGCMTSMLYVASHKTIVIADTIRDETDVPGGMTATHNEEQAELLLRRGGAEKNKIHIPLAKGTKAENVVMENRYMEQELWIYLKEAEEDFYQENEIYGDMSVVQNGYFDANSDGVILKLCMTDVLEYRSTMESDTLVIACYNPKELYEQLVVIDPSGGGSESGSTVERCEEKEITLQVAKQLQKKAEQENIKIYFTRMEDIDVSYQERIEFAEAAGADIYICIGVCEDAEHPEYYGIHSFYNEEYFIPEFGNIQLADVLTRNVTVSASNRAIGLTPADEDSILKHIKIPAAEVCMGYLSNEQERMLLQQEHYQEKLAEGLANAILEVYTKKDISDEVGEL